MEKEIFEKEEESLELDIPKEERHLSTMSYDYSVEFLVDMLKGNSPKILLELPFQRKFIWGYVRASQLIESIIMNVPIPPLYFAEKENGKWMVIDGVQRLHSILSYFQNEYGLKKLEITKDLEKYKYKDLPPKAKSLLNDGMIRVNVIKKDSTPEIKYDIFMRLNKGSVILNYQELRNCLYRGHLNDAAKEIVNTNKDLLAILKLEKPHERFLDVEFVIRFFVLSENLKVDEKGNYYLKNYTGRLVTYINKFMHEKQNIKVEEKAQYKNKYNSIIKKVVNVFGIEEAFRDPMIKTIRVNKPLADLIMLSFERISDKVLVDNKDTIKKLLRDLLSKDDKFGKSISQRTSDKDVVNYRINFWFKELNNVIPF